MIKKELTIDLEKDPNFEIDSLIENTTLKYRGHSFSPHMNKAGELSYSIKNDNAEYPVIHAVKSIKAAKLWVDAQSKRKMKFKPFSAYMENNGRLQLIKVNSLSKDASEFNATTERGDRFAIKRFSSRVFKVNPANTAIVGKIREQEAIKTKASSQIYKLIEQLEVDNSLTTYFKEIREVPE